MGTVESMHRSDEGNMWDSVYMWEVATGGSARSTPSQESVIADVF